LSDLPFLPLWVSTYEAHTAHLSLCEDGAYNRLLRLCWRTPGCSLPADDTWVMRQMRVDQNSFDAFVKPVLSEFFKVRRGRYVNDKLKEVFDEATAKTERRKSAGRKGGEAKARKTKEVLPSNATSELEQCSSKIEPELELELQPETKKEEAVASSEKRGPNGIRLSPDWTLPDDWLAEARRIAFQLKAQLTDQEIRNEADKFRDYWVAAPGAKGRKCDWLATWRTWIRNSIERRQSRGHAPGRGGQAAFAQHGRGSIAAAAARRADQRANGAVLSGELDWGDDVEGARRRNGDDAVLIGRSTISAHGG